VAIVLLLYCSADSKQRVILDFYPIETFLSFPEWGRCGKTCDGVLSQAVSFKVGEAMQRMA
jgi:hypothetical protein